jgi:hypothetical protein
MVTASDIEHMRRSQIRSANIGNGLLPVVACVLIVGGVKISQQCLGLYSKIRY